MRIQMGCQVAIVKLSVRNPAKITKNVNFLVVRLCDFTVSCFELRFCRKKVY